MFKTIRHPQNQRGFSLIELMIVIAIIGLLIAVGVPAWNSMVRSGNQNAAIQTMTQIGKSQGNYKLLKNGDYGTFDELITEVEFNENFKGEKPTFNGYVYTMEVRKKAPGVTPFYSVKASPETDSTGSQHYYIESGKTGIKYSDEGEAGPESKPLSVQ